MQEKQGGQGDLGKQGGQGTPDEIGKQGGQGGYGGSQQGGMDKDKDKQNPVRTER